MKSVLAGALALTAMLGAASAQATTVTDPAGDFLSSFIGMDTPDLDALSASVSIVGSNFVVSGTMNGAIDTTPGKEYVFGVNTGGALPLFSVQAPPGGAPDPTTVNHILFDDVIVLAPGAGSFVADDLTNPAGPTVVGLDGASVTISGATISAVVPISDLPSTGLMPGRFGFNLWPRLSGTDFDQIADFAPNNSTFAAVPEPASWGLMILGLGTLGAAMRGRRRRIAAVAV